MWHAWGQQFQRYFNAFIVVKHVLSHLFLKVEISVANVILQLTILQERRKRAIYESTVNKVLYARDHL